MVQGYVMVMLVVLVEANLQEYFYSRSCPEAQLVIRDMIAQEYAEDPAIAPALLRLHFHDCFVRGCDGSVLLDSGRDFKAEKESSFNFGVRGFTLVDSIKAQLEARCPRVVSCADILAFAARDAIYLTSGPFYQVPAGRRDGKISDDYEATANLPSPFYNFQQLTHLFAKNGLSPDDMITLSGAHTIGRAHCFTFMKRLYNFDSNYSEDPSLNRKLALVLKSQCPRGDLDLSRTVSMDPITPGFFDNRYYVNVALGKGLLSSDQVLITDPLGAKVVHDNSIDELSWRFKFVDAMIRMGSTGVLTNDEGEVRANCRFINYF